MKGQLAKLVEELDADFAKRVWAIHLARARVVARNRHKPFRRMLRMLMKIDESNENEPVKFPSEDSAKRQMNRIMSALRKRPAIKDRIDVLRNMWLRVLRERIVKEDYTHALIRGQLPFGPDLAELTAMEERLWYDTRAHAFGGKDGWYLQNLTSLDSTFFLFFFHSLSLSLSFETAM
jgi:hypothetical protein